MKLHKTSNNKGWETVPGYACRAKEGILGLKCPVGLEVDEFPIKVGNFASVLLFKNRNKSNFSR